MQLLLAFVWGEICQVGLQRVSLWIFKNEFKQL